MREPPSVANIHEASTVIHPAFRDTPQFHADQLSRLTGAQLTVKIETLNPIRSFKGRGTDYLLHRLHRETNGTIGPLVCASAGNFGQGLAFAARAHRVPLTVFAAENANPLKVQRMRDLGAQVVQQGHDFDAAKDAARRHAEATGARYIEDGRETPIAEGAGTIALELLRDGAAYDAILVPLGNGALVGGMGRWIKAHSPDTRVIGVSAAGAPAMARSWHAGESVTTERADTIADGIAVRVPVPEALHDLQGTLDDVMLVDDGALRRAVNVLLDTLGLIIEPSGAAGIAALLTHPERFAGLRVASPLCGANVTREQLHAWLE